MRALVRERPLSDALGHEPPYSDAYLNCTDTGLLDVKICPVVPS